MSSTATYVRMIGCSCAANRLPDADQGSVRLGRNPSLPEIRVRGAKGEAVYDLVELSQGVYVVADDLQVVNGHLGTPLFDASASD